MRFLQRNRRGAEATCFFTPQRWLGPGAYSPKKVSAKRAPLFATQNEVKYAMFVPQGMRPNTPCLALLWRLFLVVSFWKVFRVPALHAFEHLGDQSEYGHQSPHFGQISCFLWTVRGWPFGFHDGGPWAGLEGDWESEAWHQLECVCVWEDSEGNGNYNRRESGE